MKKHLMSFGAVFALALATGSASQANQLSPQPYVENYNAAIWVDPDGCEHWIMDTGVEGFMSQHLDRNGRPVCGRNVCHTFEADTLFAVDSSTVNANSRAEIEAFFRKQVTQGSTFRIVGHTDSTASNAYNQALSERRANAVAAIARSVGASVTTAGLGETQPVATNGSKEGRARNRRVEIFCQ